MPMLFSVFDLWRFAPLRGLCLDALSSCVSILVRLFDVIRCVLRLEDVQGCLNSETNSKRHRRARVVMEFTRFSSSESSFDISILYQFVEVVQEAGFTLVSRLGSQRAIYFHMRTLDDYKRSSQIFPRYSECSPVHASYTRCRDSLAVCQAAPTLKAHKLIANRD
jgi:hypothetical protein